MYQFKFTSDKIAIMFVLAYLSYQIAGTVTRWLYEHDVFLILCFIMVLWGMSYGPVWVFDWLWYKFNQFVNKSSYRQ